MFRAPDGARGHVVILLLLVTSVVFDPTLARRCSRWNCPCSGSYVTKRDYDVEKRWYQNYHVDAENARRQTKQIMNKMINQRFSDEEHTALLRDCSDRRNPECLHVHLQPDCSMAGLPTLAGIQRMGQQNVRGHPHGVNRFAIMAQNLLSRLAVFVDQARRDEERYVTNRHHSLADDIRLLEEQHLYHILCNLHVDFSAKSIPWNANVSHELMQLGCRLLSSQAPIDNRNYMVFYTLERLLQNMSSQFRRVVKRSVGSSNNAVFDGRMNLKSRFLDMLLS